jgi:hypothetical protein
MSLGSHGALVIAWMAMGLTACGSPTGPSGRAIVTFQVVAETFRVRLDTPAQVAAARAAQAGGRARIPLGRIVAGTQVNTGWSWHLEEIEFAEVTIEVCDGLPSHVEREGTRFANGVYCPWSARVIAIDER